METLTTLNQRLRDHFGIDDAGQPIFRIVWADHETEKRLVDHSDNGILFLQPTVMEVKKYPYLKGLHVLERLVVIPDINKNELPGAKLSYEPIWAYRDENHYPLFPNWPATKFIVDTLLAALGKKSLRKYVDSEKNTTQEGRDQQITELQEELFGDNTETTDALRYKEAIVVPRSYEKSNQE